jgi:hypothetical protein
VGENGRHHEFHPFYSRKAWNFLRELGTDLNTGASSPAHQITSNDIASRLQRISKVPIDQSHLRSTKRALSQKPREFPIDPDLSANFSTKELNTALLAVKCGKADGFDGVYPEFIKNSGQRTKEWIIVTLFNNILTSGKIPKQLEA